MKYKEQFAAAIADSVLRLPRRVQPPMPPASWAAVLPSIIAGIEGGNGYAKHQLRRMAEAADKGVTLNAELRP